MTIGALGHVAGHVMGPETIAFMGAPPDVVKGARDGTVLYYVMMIAIIGLLSGLAYLSKKQNKNQLTRLFLWVFTCILLLRGLLFILFIPPIINGTLGPDPRKFLFHFFASIFVLTIGMSLVPGLWKSGEN
ncbi:MAG: hypothetical protein ABJG88_09880 [Litorimonas sp.]